jgi:hypothetical protein
VIREKQRSYSDEGTSRPPVDQVPVHPASSRTLWNLFGHGKDPDIQRTPCPRELAINTVQLRPGPGVVGSGRGVVALYLSGMADEAEPSARVLTFDPVWLIRERPRLNLDPARFLAPGKLVLDGHRAEFSPSDARLVSAPSPRVHLTCDHIVDVHLKRFGWGLAPRYVVITYDKSEGGNAVAYFNDAGWKGWRPLLTRSNARMASAIRRNLGITP